MPRIRPIATSRALPATITALHDQRIVARKLSLVDEVEQVLDALFEDAEFRRLREALEPEDTVGGNIFIDDVLASEMIKKKGTEMRLPLIKEAKLDKIGAALRRAESRFNASRKQRKQAPAAA
jgi:hypothetical protein